MAVIDRQGTGERLLIENAETAKYISELLLQINGQLDESVAKVKDRCSPDEFTADQADWQGVARYHVCIFIARA